MTYQVLHISNGIESSASFETFSLYQAKVFLTEAMNNFPNETFIIEGWAE